MAILLQDATKPQEVALAIVPKITSFLSICASAYIIFDIIRTYLKRRDSIKLYHNILFGMSITELLASCAWFFTTWPIPKQVLDVWGANGNEATCTAQGFFVQFSVATIFYNGFLALHYVLILRCGWTDEQLRQARFATWAHVVSIGFALITAATSAGLGLFNPVGWDCWISSVPLICSESWRSQNVLEEEWVECIRGNNANLYQWLFFYIPLWIIITFVTVAMALVWLAYKSHMEESRQLEARLPKAVRLASQERFEEQEEQFKSFTVQSVLYVISFYIVWFFPTVLRIHETTTDFVYYRWVLLSALFTPIQGVLSFLVYLRPQIAKRRLERRRSKRREESSGSGPFSFRRQMSDARKEYEEKNKKNKSNNRQGTGSGSEETSSDENNSSTATMHASEVIALALPKLVSKSIVDWLQDIGKAISKGESDAIIELDLGQETCLEDSLRPKELSAMNKSLSSFGLELKSRSLSEDGDIENRGSSPFGKRNSTGSCSSRSSIVLTNASKFIQQMEKGSVVVEDESNHERHTISPRSESFVDRNHARRSSCMLVRDGQLCIALDLVEEDSEDDDSSSASASANR